MSLSRTLRDERLGHDAGLSLLEVIVAVALVTIVMTASAALCLTGIATASAQERRQVAVTIASGMMESVGAQSVATNSVTGVSGLYTGRSSSAVSAVWAANPSTVGVSQTYSAWDPTATIASVPVIPITSTSTQAGTTFTVQTLMGPCYEPKAGGDCTIVAGATGTVTPSGYTRLIRIVVVVTWTAGDSCAASGCSYTTSSLVDPSSDLGWLTSV
jgi:prepilin-type N-terminal cleavage/methylation domain-containing protein